MKDMMSSSVTHCVSNEQIFVFEYFAYIQTTTYSWLCSSYHDTLGDILIGIPSDGNGRGSMLIVSSG